MNTLKFHTWFSEEDGCWLTKSYGFPNGQTTTNHGDTPEESMKECVAGSTIILNMLAEGKR